MLGIRWVYSIWGRGLGSSSWLYGINGAVRIIVGVFGIGRRCRGVTQGNERWDVAIGSNIIRNRLVVPLVSRVVVVTVS